MNAVPLTGLMAVYRSADVPAAPEGGGQVEGLRALLVVAADLGSGDLYVIGEDLRVVPAPGALGQAWTLDRVVPYELDPLVKVSDFPPTWTAESLLDPD